MITSAGSTWSSDVAIQDWRDAGLNVPCKVRFKLFTLEGSMVIRRIGALTERDGRSVRAALARFLVT